MNQDETINAKRSLTPSTTFCIINKVWTVLTTRCFVLEDAESCLWRNNKPHQYSVFVKKAPTKSYDWLYWWLETATCSLCRFPVNRNKRLSTAGTVSSATFGLLSAARSPPLMQSAKMHVEPFTSVPTYKYRTWPWVGYRRFPDDLDKSSSTSAWASIWRHSCRHQYSMYGDVSFISSRIATKACANGIDGAVKNAGAWLCKTWRVCLFRKLSRTWRHATVVTRVDKGKGWWQLVELC